MELEKAVSAAIKSQNEKHAQVIEAELKRQESDFLVWHGDEIRRRRPHNRLKKLVGSIRKGKGRQRPGKARLPTHRGLRPAEREGERLPRRRLFRRISRSLRKTPTSYARRERAWFPRRSRLS